MIETQNCANGCVIMSSSASLNKRAKNILDHDIVWFTLHVSHTKITTFRDEVTSTLAGFHVQCTFSILVQLEFENDVFFAEGGKLEKNLCSKARTNNKLNSHDNSPGHHPTC